MAENSIVSASAEVQEVLANPFLQDLGEIMSDDKFSAFFEKHFSTIDDTKVSLVYMKLYKEIQDKYHETHEGKIDKITCLCLIKYIMNSPQLRPKVIDAAVNQYNDKESITKVISDASMKHLLMDNI